MSLLKDKKIITLIIILVLFTLSYFIIVNKVSYAFLDNTNLNAVYDSTIKTIEKCAAAYGKQHLELFEKEKIIYIKVQDLIDSNLLATNENGNIINPLNIEENLNSKVIKIKLEQDEFFVEVDS